MKRIEIDFIYLGESHIDSIPEKRFSVQTDSHTLKWILNEANDTRNFKVANRLIVLQLYYRVSFSFRSAFSL